MPSLRRPARRPTPEDVAQAANRRRTDDRATTIVVTATKRASTVQDVPFSINAQTEEDIQRANAATIEDISRNVAGLAVQNLGPGQSQVSVRGVSAGQIVRDQPGVKEQVGVYLDETVISLSLFTPDFDLFDLNRVETLRGPQGTLFGSGSVGGTLRYITNQPKIGRTEGTGRKQYQHVHDGDIGGHSRARSTFRWATRRRCALSATATNSPASSMPSARPAARTSTTATASAAASSLLFQPTPELKITPRVVYQKVEAGGFNREELLQPLRQPVHTRAGRRPRQARAIFAVPREVQRQDAARRPHRDATISGGRADLGHQLHQSRHPGQPRCFGADRFGVSIDRRLIPTVASLPAVEPARHDRLKQCTQELRLASTGTGPFQWVVGGFYSNVDRKYAQRLPTPGYDAFIDALSGAGTRPRRANGFPANSPYNADLPYDIKQKALFGEASYDFGQFKLTGRRPLL